MSGARHTGRLEAVAARARARLAWQRRRRADRGFVPGLAHDPAAPILVLSPHPDDAVFSCWSILAANEPATVANVFAAVPPPGSVTYWDRICAARDSAEQMRARLAEDRDALAQLVGSPVCLPLFEEQYRATPPTLRELDRALSSAVGAAAAVYAPAAVGASHVDHRLVRGLARAIARTGIPVRLYADLPYAARYGWPPWVTGAPAHPHLDVEPYWEPLVADVPEIGELRAAQVVRLDADDAARKLAGMRTYATQFHGLDRGRILSDPDTHRYEIFWTLGAAEPA
jgi:LmbE family N-acetylglucosaminyl deacetylase